MLVSAAHLCKRCAKQPAAYGIFSGEWYLHVCKACLTPEEALIFEEKL